jgi:hypothetical protein
VYSSLVTAPMPVDLYCMRRLRSQLEERLHGKPYKVTAFYNM